MQPLPANTPHVRCRCRKGEGWEDVTDLDDPQICYSFKHGIRTAKGGIRLAFKILAEMEEGATEAAWAAARAQRARELYGATPAQLAGAAAQVPDQPAGG
jgi:hypothetical protein